MPATGADLPPEVIVIIPTWVGTNPYGVLEQFWWKVEGLPDLQRCALVCLYWANKCRRWIFAGRIRPRTTCITPRSLAELEELEFYAVHGSACLEALKDLVRSWTIEQHWNANSWCHHRQWSLFKCKHIQNSGRRSALTGPKLPSLPLTVLHIPHWSIPKTLPSCFTPFIRVELSDVHFPSLARGRVPQWTSQVRSHWMTLIIDCNFPD